MITENDLNSAIAECKGKRNPDASTCIKLAAFYIIRKELYGEPASQPAYSFASAPTNTIQIESNSEFANAVNGMDAKELLSVIDELMQTIKAIQPRLYDAVMRKLT